MLPTQRPFDPFTAHLPYFTDFPIVGPLTYAHWFTPAGWADAPAVVDADGLVTASDGVSNGSQLHVIGLPGQGPWTLTIVFSRTGTGLTSQISIQLGNVSGIPTQLVIGSNDPSPTNTSIDLVGPALLRNALVTWDDGDLHELVLVYDGSTLTLTDNGSPLLTATGYAAQAGDRVAVLANADPDVTVYHMRSFEITSP